MKFRRLFAVAIALVLTGSASAGSLAPPPGPVAPTMKSLTEVEPRTSVQSLSGSASALYVISQPGSYYLTGNVQGVAGKDGIAIMSGNVSLDLNGFALIGSGGSGHGITNVPGTPYYNVIVKNGTVRNWGGTGVRADIWGAIVSDIASFNNGENGIVVGAQSVAARCTTKSNGGLGIGGYSTCSIVDCVSRENVGNGFEVPFASTLRGNISVYNGANGIVSETQCTIEGNLVAGNVAAGIRVSGSSNRVDGNHCVDNGIGIQGTGCGSVFVHNTAHGNAANYSIAGCNDVGPISTAAAATSPMANIAY